MTSENACLINRATDTKGLDTSKCTAVIQGFGSVGSVTACSRRRYSAEVITNEQLLLLPARQTKLDRPSVQTARKSSVTPQFSWSA